MSEKQNVICVDLDGTLAEYDEWKGHDHIGAPISSIVHLLHVLRERGWIIKIFTCRLNGVNTKGRGGLSTRNREPIEKWLNEFNIPYDEITMSREGKPFAHVYLDDRAVNPHDFANNTQILAVCEKLGKHGE